MLSAQLTDLLGEPPPGPCLDLVQREAFRGQFLLSTRQLNEAVRAWRGKILEENAKPIKPVRGRKGGG